MITSVERVPMMEREPQVVRVRCHGGASLGGAALTESFFATLECELPEPVNESETPRV